MASIVADTHIVVWLVTNSPRLSARAKETIDQTIASGFPVLMSAISIAEIIYLTEKMKLPQSVLHSILDATEREEYGLRVTPFDHAMAVTMQKVSRDLVPDMPDRMIAATAIALNVPLISADEKIRRSGITVIW